MYCDLWPHVPLDFQIQKIIVSKETIWENTVCQKYKFQIYETHIFVAYLWNKQMSSWQNRDYFQKRIRYKKFIYSEKTTKFCKIFPLLLSVWTVDKCKVKISQNFVAFSEYMNFKVHKFLDSLTCHKILFFINFVIGNKAGNVFWECHKNLELPSLPDLTLLRCT